MTSTPPSVDDHPSAEKLAKAWRTAAYDALASTDGQVPRSMRLAMQLGDEYAATLRLPSAPLSYVTSEGVVRLPPGIIEQLGLQGGGGVVFHVPDRALYVQLMTNDQFLATIGQADDQQCNGQTQTQLRTT